MAIQIRITGYKYSKMCIERKEEYRSLPIKLYIILVIKYTNNNFIINGLPKLNKIDINLS